MEKPVDQCRVHEVKLLHDGKSEKLWLPGLAHPYVVAVCPDLHLPRKTFTLVLTDARKGKTLFSLILFLISLSLSLLFFPRVTKRKDDI